MAFTWIAAGGFGSCENDDDEFDAAATVADFNCPAQNASGNEETQAAVSLLRFLDPRTRRIVEQHVMHERTLSDIGDEEGISRERVRQIVVSGMEKMRTAADRLGITLPN